MEKPVLWWSRPLLFSDSGERPNSPPQSTIVESSSPRRFRSLISAGDRLVGQRGHLEVVLFDIAVRVPFGIGRAAAGDHADEAHALLHHAARQQAAAAVVVGLRIADAVEIERLLRLLAEVEDFRRLGLHLERRVVGRDARRELGIFARQIGFVERADQVERLAPLRQRRRPSADRDSAPACCPDGTWSADRPPAGSRSCTSAGRLPARRADPASPRRPAATPPPSPARRRPSFPSPEIRESRGRSSSDTAPRSAPPCRRAWSG